MADPQAAPTVAASAPAPAKKPLGRSHGWFAWWVCACIAILAYQATEQLRTQQRILDRSRELEEIVAEAAAVSGEMQEQLAVVAELQAVTAQLELKIQGVTAVNAQVKGHLQSLEQTVAQVVELIARLDGQTALSGQTLAAIHQQSTLLKATLEYTGATAADLQGALVQMADLQRQINADLATMDQKTQLLDDYVGGR